MSMALFGLPNKGAQAQEATPGTFTIVKECVNEDDDEDEIFEIEIDFEFDPDDLVEIGDPVDEDDDFDIDDIELACDEFIDIGEADVQPLVDWFIENEANITDGSAIVSEDDVPAGVTAEFSAGCVLDLTDIDTLVDTGIVCTITNTFPEGGIDIDNTNTNTLNNNNTNDNSNGNTNTQDQSNEQTQINDNNQVTTVNSSPTVKITGLPRSAAAPPSPTIPPGVVNPPSTGEGFLRAPSTGEGLFIAPPNTGDAGLASPVRSESGVSFWIVGIGLAGALTLAGVKFSRAGR
jgi:hypothetical protein